MADAVARASEPGQMACMVGGACLDGLPGCQMLFAVYTQLVCSRASSDGVFNWHMLQHVQQQSLLAWLFGVLPAHVAVDVPSISIVGVM